MDDSERSAISGATAAWIVATVILITAAMGWAGYERLLRHQAERQLSVATTTIQMMKEWVVSLNDAANREADEAATLRHMLGQQRVQRLTERTARERGAAWRASP